MASHEPQPSMANDDPLQSLNSNTLRDGEVSTTTGLDTGAEASSTNLDEKRRILRERARKLAQPPERDDSQDEGLEVIVFMLAQEKYAIELKHVREVYPLRDLTPVPCTPSFVAGIINIRGQVISVVDVKEFFDLPKTDPTELFKVLVVKNDHVEFGIMSDEIMGEQKIPLDQIEADMPVLRGIREGYVRGVTKEPLVILDGEKLLSDDRIVVHQEVGD
jgi:purine-binding chemotaxis protein CheW